MKRWIVPVIEIRAAQVEYVVEADTMDEAIRRAQSGQTWDAYDRGGYDITGRNLDLSEQIREDGNFAR